MAIPPPPFSEITGTSAIVGKYNQQESIANVNGNARPGQLIVDLDTDPPLLYVGNNLGNINLVASGGGNGIPLSNGTSVINIPFASGNITLTTNGTYTWDFADTGNLTLPGNMNITGNIIPSSDITYDLGNSTNRWRDLYLSGNTIYLGNATITANSAGVNISGQMSGDAEGLSNIPAANITGNFPYLQVSNSDNATGVITQIGSNTIAFDSAYTSLPYKVEYQYHPNASTNYPGHRHVRSRGNVTNPTTAVNGDRILSRGGWVFNGTTNVLAVSENMSATGTTVPGNVAWTGGQWVMSTGNPSGDTANTTALSPINALIFNNSGSLQIIPGTAPNTSLGQTQTPFLLQSYGLNTSDLSTTGALTFQRARGNRDSNVSIQAGDQTMRITGFAYSNGIYQSANALTLRGLVSSSYTNNDTVIPQDFQIQTLSNVAGVATFRTTIFYGNGLTTLPGNIYFSNANAYLSMSSTGQISLGKFNGPTTQGTSSISIGQNAGNSSQGSSAIAVGLNAGVTSQGNNGVAIGSGAGRTNQANNTIILNATGGNLDQTTANTLTVKPVRAVATTVPADFFPMYYNPTTGEIIVVTT